MLQRRLSTRHTDVRLPEEVALPLGDLGAGEFPVNLIMDITHGDEGGDNAVPFTGLHCPTSLGIFLDNMKRSDALVALMVP